MTVLAGAVQARPAREDHVGNLQQLILSCDHLRRGAAEARQFVHAVVDDRLRIQVAQQRKGHGRVEPHDGSGNLFLYRKPPQQAAQNGCLIVMEAAGRDWTARTIHEDVA